MNKWNENTHQIYWSRRKDAAGIYMYRIICDDHEVYSQEIDPTNISLFEAEKMHHAFLNIVERYRKEGVLPGRISRIVKK